MDERISERITRIVVSSVRAGIRRAYSPLGIDRSQRAFAATNAQAPGTPEPYRRTVLSDEERTCSSHRRSPWNSSIPPIGTGRHRSHRINLVASSLCESESSQRIPLGRQAAEALPVSSRSRPITRAISSIDGFSIGIALVQHAIQTVFQALSTASRNAEPRIDFGVNGFDFLHRGMCRLRTTN